MTHHNPAVQEIMDTYTPVEIKKLIDRSTNKEFVHHQKPEDIVAFYGEFNEDIHHWLLDATHAWEYYAECQGAYNKAQAQCKDEDERFAVQQYFIKDVVYIFIATVCYDLAYSHGLIDKTMKEVEDWQLNIDLEHRKKQLKVIDGGKK